MGRDVAGERAGVLLALFAALGFSLKAVFVKLAYAWPVGAVTLIALRMLLSLPVFAWVGWKSGRTAQALGRRDYLTLAALGMVGYYGSTLLDFLGLQYISAGLERLILYTYPTFTVLIAVIFFKKKLFAREAFSILLSYIGIGLAFAHDLDSAGQGVAAWTGGALVLASSFCYALYLTGSAPMIVRLGSARFTALCMLVSTLGVLTHFAVSEPLTALILPWQVYGLCAAMAVFSTVLPVFMLSAAIRRIGASRSVLIGAIGPMGTIFFGWWWLDEAISPHQTIGAALVLTGVLLVSLGGRDDPGGKQ
ncbi:MAG: DMT family transporter [Zoogloeaceae bacterium]|jgi:drug/metabolite transporter (DMT)-like permease|nr:DMT family transporter [Zoogloeaceae bacterium]